MVGAMRYRMVGFIRYSMRFLYGEARHNAWESVRNSIKFALKVKSKGEEVMGTKRGRMQVREREREGCEGGLKWIFLVSAEIQRETWFIQNSNN